MEIEKKWLVKKEKIPYNLDELEKIDIEQAYISFNPVIRIRKVDGKKCVLTVKSSKVEASLSREESEIHISLQQYNNLMKKTEGIVLKKTRYFCPRVDGLLEEIDVFKNEYDGLVYLEIEFPDVETARNFPDPYWVEENVTEIPGYGNASLAGVGFKTVKN